MVYVGYNDAKKRANEKYKQTKIDTITCYPPKGTKDTLRKLAEERKMSLNAIMCKITAYAIEHPEILD